MVPRKLQKHQSKKQWQVMKMSKSFLKSSKTLFLALASEFPPSQHELYNKHTATGGVVPVALQPIIG